MTSEVDKVALRYAKQFDPSIISSQVELIGGGYNSNGYKITYRNNNPIVLLVENDFSPEKIDYSHEFAVLTTLKESEYSHSPQPIWISPDRNAMVISFANGTPLRHLDFSTVNLTKKDLALKIIDSVFKMFDTPYEKYFEVCKRQNVKPKKVEMRKETLNIYQVQRLKVATLLLGDNNKYIKWLKAYQEPISQFAAKPSNKSILTHGDVGSGHIIINPNNNDVDITIIDWGISRFVEYTPDGDLAYILKNSGFLADYKKEIIEWAAKKNHMSTIELSESVDNRIRGQKYRDILWNIWMYSLAISGKIKADPAYFIARADERIAKYEKLYL